jgi:uncharacterized protein YnzC (UPF0291/DUF896 family)
VDGLTRVVTYEARDKRNGMTPAEVTIAVKDAVRIKNWRGTLRGKIRSITVVEEK